MNAPPLSPHVAIVDSQGRPTSAFLQWIQRQRDVNDEIVPLGTAGEVSAVLDRLGDDQGSVLYRDSANWNALGPGIAGRVLTTQGAGANPTWDTVASTFLSLTDAPSSYTGEGGRVVAVKGDESGLEFISGGGGGGSQPLGFAKFTKPGNVFTAVNSGSPTLNAYDATLDVWTIQHTGDQGVSFALTPGLSSDGVVVLRVHVSMADLNFVTVGVAYGDSATSRRTAVGFSFGNIMRKQFWNGTTFVSETTVTPTGTSASHFYGPWVYYKLTRAGTAIATDISRDGLLWQPVTTGTTTENSMSGVNRVGIYVNSASATSTARPRISCFGLDTSQQAEATT